MWLAVVQFLVNRAKCVTKKIEKVNENCAIRRKWDSELYTPFSPKDVCYSVSQFPSTGFHPRALPSPRCLICIVASVWQAVAATVVPASRTILPPHCNHLWCKCGNRRSWYRTRSYPWRTCRPDRPHPRRNRSAKSHACHRLQGEEIVISKSQF